MTSWDQIIPPEAMHLALELSDRAQACRDAGEILYPRQDQLFRALDLTQPDRIKAVLVGQDPYIFPGQAEGLCFSVAPGTDWPPSLRNIFTEYCGDLRLPVPCSGSLVPWAEHGVLLLNTSLTVKAGQTASCADWGWDRFTSAVFRAICGLPQPVVFIAWGRHAQNAMTAAGITASDPERKKFLICSSHPSPWSADRGFFRSKPFSRTNALLKDAGAEPVNWQLPFRTEKTETKGASG